MQKIKRHLVPIVGFTSVLIIGTVFTFALNWLAPVEAQEPPPNVTFSPPTLTAPITLSGDVSGIRALVEAEDAEIFCDVAPAFQGLVSCQPFSGITVIGAIDLIDQIQIGDTLTIGTLGFVCPPGRTELSFNEIRVDDDSGNTIMIQIGAPHACENGGQ